jgi:hypothetical protein
MKKYFFGITALALAITFSAFTKNRTTTYSFKLKSEVDLSSLGAVESKTNWIVSSEICDGVEDIPCIITVQESFTNGTGISQKLNPSGDTIFIVSKNGFLATASNPDVHYRRIGDGTNYTHKNKHTNS